MELYEKYGIDGIMIGRGIFQNPFAFAKVEASDIVLENKSRQLLNLLNYQLDLFDKYNEELEPRKFDPLKRYFKIYVRDFAGASELREKLMHTKSTDEVRQLLAYFSLS
jgi:tRNA-dihydrouridine synthase